jgi:hypothetical protein
VPPAEPGQHLEKHSNVGAAVRSDDLEARLDAAVLYAAMLGATLAGQLGGIAIDALIGSRGFWIPAGCSVVLEAVTGARMSARRAKERPTPRRVVRLSATYSLVLVSLCVPLAVWSSASRPVEARAHVSWTTGHMLVAAGVLALATALRALLMIVFVVRNPVQDKEQ